MNISFRSMACNRIERPSLATRILRRANRSLATIHRESESTGSVRFNVSNQHAALPNRAVCIHLSWRGHKTNELNLEIRMRRNKTVPFSIKPSVLATALALSAAPGVQAQAPALPQPSPTNKRSRKSKSRVPACLH